MIDSRVLAALKSEHAESSVFDLLSSAIAEFKDDLRIACSFGVEDMVIVHEAARAAKAQNRAIRVFLLDTGRLHQETFDLLDVVRSRYHVNVEAYFPNLLATQNLVRSKGANSFYQSVENRKECCAIRKLEPLARALSGARAWVTGLRRDQSPTRSDVQIVESDDANGIIKLNPLANWSEKDVWDFVSTHDVPTHALHAKGYASIGCAPCTRAIEPGEHVRAGRWWWEEPEHKECGIHNRPPAKSGLNLGKS